MKTTMITCDECGRNLTSTGNCIDYRLVLHCEEVPCRGGVVTLLAIEPPISGTMAFCGLRCLEKWLERTKG